MNKSKFLILLLLIWLLPLSSVPGQYLKRDKGRQISTVPSVKVSPTQETYDSLAVAQALIATNVTDIAALPTFPETGGLVGDSLTDLHSFKDEVLKYMSFDEDSVVVDSNFYVFGKVWIRDSLIVNTRVLFIPPDDSSAVGNIILRQAGENLVFLNSCYLKSDGKYWKTDADGAATMPSRLVSIAIISADGWGLFMDYGYLRCDALDLTIGGDIFPGVTPGELTQTQVSGTGDQSQKVGHGETPDVVKYQVDQTVLEIK